MLHAGLDLSRKRLDVCLIDEAGEVVGRLAAPPDVDGLRGLVGRVAPCGEPVRGVIESMTGARFVHDSLERLGWEVLIADAQRVKGLAPLACKTDKIDAQVLAVLSHRDLVPAIWLPNPRVRREREQARFRLHLVKHKSSLKCRIHSTMITFGDPCPVTDLFGVAGPRAARPARGPAAVALNDRRQPRADRRPRAPHRRDQPRAQDRRCRPPLRSVAVDRAGNWVGAGVHHRRRDR